MNALRYLLINAVSVGRAEWALPGSYFDMFLASITHWINETKADTCWDAAAAHASVAKPALSGIAHTTVAYSEVGLANPRFQDAQATNVGLRYPGSRVARYYGTCAFKEVETAHLNGRCSTVLIPASAEITPQGAWCMAALRKAKRYIHERLSENMRMENQPRVMVPFHSPAGIVL
jgi:hypothetical protein